MISQYLRNVKDGEYYTNAVMWANANGIVTGYGDSGLFGPNDRINREQMVTMLFRYAKYLEADDLESGRSYDKFPDGERVKCICIRGDGMGRRNGYNFGYEDGETGTAGLYQPCSLCGNGSEISE